MDEAADCDHFHLFDHLANDRECINTRLPIRRDVVGTDVVELVDFFAPDELVYLDRPSALQRWRLKLPIRDLDVLALGDFVTFDDVIGGDLFTYLLINPALADAVGFRMGFSLPTRSHVGGSVAIKGKADSKTPR